MKKLIRKLFTILLVIALGYFVYINYIKETVAFKVIEEEKVIIDKYYVYGNHLNIEGNLEITDKNYDNIYLTLYNGEDKDIEIKTDIEDNKINFTTSESINEGIYLDDIERGTYYLFIKINYKKEESEEVISKYYALNNNTKYKTLDYYTLSKYNNKIIINSDNDYPTMMLNVNENDNKDNYDITIDPGHGGMDSGALNGKYKEADFTMKISKKIESNLKKEGLKVKLTHDEKDLTKDETLDEYDTHGRAVIPNEVKSKYTFSIHINTNTSKNVKGVEVYTPANINYDFASSLADTIVNNTKLSYSTNKLYKVSDGVYTHNFTESEIESAKKSAREKNRNIYDITTNSNYLYMIRETGGFMTGAYVDNRNKAKVGENPYYNSNIGNEAYLIEVAYMSNQNDLDILLNSINAIADSISNAIIEEINKKV